MVLALVPAAAVRAQTCLETSLRGLPSVATAGTTVQVSAELGSDCNYKVVDAATLVCEYSNGVRTRAPMVLESGTAPAHATVELLLPDDGGSLTGECHVEFTQCNRTVRTCPLEIQVQHAVAPSPSPTPATGSSGSTPPPVWPTPNPPPRRRPAPGSQSASRPGGFLRGLGWIGVTVGLAEYADASSKRQNGMLEEAKKSEDLGDQALAAGGVLLLLGYSASGSNFVADRETPQSWRFRPALAVDPVHRSLFVQVSFRF